ncbi:hypothetical protein DFO61_2321 [Ectopseudomonas oleovorans]|uniref:FixG C-terminal immunoglobulin-like domain-containing protein n=1 Tax=Ectopseudomonas oleovorans TaxID=301 RepID=A0A397N8X4_ECTOL|nr:hypothetical protein [Pseudomonas oleovorans]RIA31597.1 hypothetical protein DFO61_2321 [Pseudomonas oleovorans]
MFEFIKEWSVLIIIGATALNLWFVYSNWSIKKAVIEIQAESLPKYSSDEEKTLITIKNVGEKATGKKPTVTISCSWMPNISYNLNFPSDGYNLEHKESMKWKIRLDNNPPANSSIIIRVSDNGAGWEHHEQIT